MRDLWISPSNTVWTVAGAGTVLGHDGTQWIGLPRVGMEPLSAISGSSDRDIWVAGETLWHWNGTSWFNFEVADTSGSFTRLFSVNTNDAWALRAHRTILHWNGTAWSRSFEWNGAPLNDLFAFTDGTAFAVGLGDALLRFDGSTWSPLGGFEPSMNWFAVSGSSSDDLWLGGVSRTTFVTSFHHWDGTGWHRSTTYRDERKAFSIQSLLSTPTDAWAVDDTGVVFHFDGAGWRHVPTPTTSLLNRIEERNGTLVTAGENGTVLVWERGAWHRLAGADEDLLSVWGSSQADVWTVGDGGVALHWDGEHWTRAIGMNVWHPTDGGVDEPFPLSHQAIWGSARDDVWLISSDTQLQHFDGFTWQPAKRAQGEGFLFGGCSRSSTQAWIGGDHLLSLEDTWFPLTLPPEVRWVRSVACTRDRELWILADTTTGSAIYHFDGMTFDQSFELPAALGWLGGLWVNDNQDVWSRVRTDSVAHWNGQRWTITPFDDGGVSLGAMTGGNGQIWISELSGSVLTGAETSLRWEPTGAVRGAEALWSSPAGDVWAVGRGGMILHRSP